MDIENAHQPEGNWTQIPNSIILSGELTPTDKAVFLVLLYKESFFVQYLQKKNFYCTKSKLSQLTGVSERTILDSLKRLEALGFIKVKRNRREGAVNLYNLDWTVINAYQPKQKEKKNAKSEKRIETVSPSTTISAPGEELYYSDPSDWMDAVGDDGYFDTMAEDFTPENYQTPVQVEVTSHSTHPEWVAAVGGENSFKHFVVERAIAPENHHAAIEDKVYFNVSLECSEAKKEDVIERWFLPAVRKYKDAAFE